MTKAGLILTVFLASTAAVRAEWPCFRGPNYDGISRETGLTVAWEKPIPLVWDRQVGAAFSSFAAVGGRLYTCGAADGQQVLYCLSTDDGSIVWKTPIEKEYRDTHGDGTRATPTIHDGRVYIQGAHGRLLCVDADKGAVVWEKAFTAKPQWGYSGSVLIEGDLAIATPGSGQGSLAAFDRKTGKPAWTCGDDPPGYGTPYPFTFNGRRYVVGFTGRSVVIADARTGALALHYPWETSYDVNAAAPIFSDGHLFITSGYDTGSALLKLTAQEDGKLSASEVWRSKVLLNKFQSCVLVDGNLYTSDQKHLHCVEFLTGKERWMVPRIKDGTLVVAEGHIFLLTEAGQLQIAELSPEGFKPKTQAEILSGRCWTVSVIDNGRLYARNMERVACFNLRG
ncbi:MAG: hypothetical protein C4547_14970 [Phycisphaerales bacterium]|nr:MAG: hypothetical protein C4547_14970 [Phycisphaerales bacterium]